MDVFKIVSAPGVGEDINHGSSIDKAFIIFKLPFIKIVYKKIAVVI